MWLFPGKSPEEFGKVVFLHLTLGDLQHRGKELLLGIQERDSIQLEKVSVAVDHRLRPEISPLCFAPVEMTQSILLSPRPKWRGLLWCVNKSGVVD